ncbi:hypothetical protein FACS189420_6840 [Bacteroidia bacterium]|nr:hypothetical protein FACS18947_3690 [Bacteroidia bacterium]GHV71506.1 hypothetical protein FACS189420_6840 [Bacteroidia bacterium]
MSIDKIHKAFVSGKAVFFIILLGFIASRLYDANGDWDNPSLWGGTIIQIGIALLLLQLNHVFTIIRSRTLLPALFYLTFTACSLPFTSDLTGSIAALCVVLSCFFLFHAYQEPESQIYALNMGILLTLGSLLWPQLLFFFPVFWYGFYHFRSLNFRVFLASITGIMAVYLFILAWSVYAEDWGVFLSFLPDFHELFSVQKPDFTLPEWIILCFTLLVYIFAGFNLFVSDLSEKIRTVSILRYLYFSSFIIFAPFLLQSENKSHWTLIIFIPVALLFSHFFTLSNKKLVKYGMLICFFFFWGMYIRQHFPA